MERPAPEVQMQKITRRFGPMVANDAVDLRLLPATVHALVGENGAGKSTLMRILFGLLKPDSGQIFINGAPVRINSPAQALSFGIGMIHQHFMLVPPMTVLENIVLGAEGARGLRTLPRKALADQLSALFETYGFDLDPYARIEALSVGGRQRVEIARLLYRGARLLICDEPTAVLAPPEVERFFKILDRFRAEGRAVVFITHKLAEVMEVADQVTVLRHGRVIGESDRVNLDRAQLVRWIMGEATGVAAVSETATLSPESLSPPENGAPLLSVKDLTVIGADGPPRLEKLNLTLNAGEVLGIAGVAGNGQQELAEALSGRLPFQRGELRLGESLFRPGESMHHTLRPALIPEDRSSEGLIGDFQLWENLLLGQADRVDFARSFWFGHQAARRWAAPLLKKFRVEPPNPASLCHALSGGNQQKVLCAREMTQGKQILIACQPTRGIDLASTRFIHEMLRQFATAGGGLILISADLDEILSISDQVAVLYRGRLALPVPRRDSDVESIGRQMVGID